jgi:hypothetical protein
MVRRHGCHLPAHPFQVQRKQQMCLVSTNTLFVWLQFLEKGAFGEQQNKEFTHPNSHALGDFFVNHSLNLQT